MNSISLHFSENIKKKLKALEAKVANDSIILTDAQIAALEKKKTDDEACGEIETLHPGYLGSQDTFYVGNLKGVGRIYQQNHHQQMTVPQMLLSKNTQVASQHKPIRNTQVSNDIYSNVLQPSYSRNKNPNSITQNKYYSNTLHFSRNPGRHQHFPLCHIYPNSSYEMQQNTNKNN